MQKAFFSHICSEIVPFIENAQSSIKVAMAWFTNQELFRHLLSAIRKGINVELILMDDVINRTGYAPDFNNYIEVGGRMRSAIKSPGLMHNKFCIIDDEFVITGSYNWTYYAEKLNKENIIITDDSGIIRSYICEFSRLWNSASAINSFDHYSNEHILDMDDVDYTFLNEEVEYSCQNNPNLTPYIFQPKTTIIDKDKKYVANGDMGVMMIVDDKPKIISLISEGKELPTKSDTHIGYYDNTVDQYLDVSFFCVDITTKTDDFIGKFDFSPITTGIVKKNLKVSFHVELDASGILTIYAECEDTKKTLKYTCIKRKLVRTDD